MPNAFIIHGWGGDSNGIWIPEAQEVLSKQYQVHTLDFPNTDNPIYTEWRDCFDEYLDNTGVKPGAQDIAIGHSLGAGFWYRYLAEKNRKLSHLILVAPTPDDCGIPEIKNFFEVEPDFDLISYLTHRITIFGSNNDAYISEMKFRILAEKLEADFILIPEAEHLSDSIMARSIGWPVLIDYLAKTLS